MIQPGFGFFPVCGRGRVEIEEPDHGDIEDDSQPEHHHKTAFAAFVPACRLRDHGPRPAAEKSPEMQGEFREPPILFPGTIFIFPVEQKRQQAVYDKRQSQSGGGTAGSAGPGQYREECQQPEPGKSAGERMKKGNALFFFGHGSDVPLSFFCHRGLRWCC